MASGTNAKGRATGNRRRASPKKGELVERLAKTLAKLSKDELEELVRKVDAGDVNFAELAQPAQLEDGGRLPFGFQVKLRAERERSR